MLRGPVQGVGQSFVTLDYLLLISSKQRFSLGFIYFKAI